MGAPLMRLLAATQNFGFGPTSMLNRAFNLLPEGWQVDAYVPTHLVDVLDVRPQVSVTSAPLDATAIKGSYDAAIVACDYELAAELRQVVAKVVVFDMLFWFWPELHPVIAEDILVVAQDFYGVRDRAADCASVKVVGPLLPPVKVKPLEERDNQIVVNLGGFTSPHHGREAAIVYARVLLPTIRLLLDSPSQLLIMGGSTALEALGEVLPECRPLIRLLPHDTARACIARASHYLTVPGLGSIYEPFLAGTPTFFLPPTNYSQALQLQAVVDRLGYPLVICFPRIRSKFDEAEYISDLLSWYKARSQPLSQDLQKAVVSFLGSDIFSKYTAAAMGRGLVENFGGPGEAAARRALMSYLNG
jgi:hypothetical protein